MDTYLQMVTAFKALTIPFAESEWSTRPTGDYGTIQLDYELPSLDGDNLKVERAFSGSVDLFLRGPMNAVKMNAVEDVLKRFCDCSWSINSIQYEHSTGLTHIEWVFSV